MELVILPRLNVYANSNADKDLEVWTSNHLASLVNFYRYFHILKRSPRMKSN